VNATPTKSPSTPSFSQEAQSRPLPPTPVQPHPLTPKTIPNVYKMQPPPPPPPTANPPLFLSRNIMSASSSSSNNNMQQFISSHPAPPPPPPPPAPLRASADKPAIPRQAPPPPSNPPVPAKDELEIRFIFPEFPKDEIRTVPVFRQEKHEYPSVNYKEIISQKGPSARS